MATRYMQLWKRRLRIAKLKSKPAYYNNPDRLNKLNEELNEIKKEMELMKENHEDNLFSDIKGE